MITYSITLFDNSMFMTIYSDCTIYALLPVLVYCTTNREVNQKKIFSFQSGFNSTMPHMPHFLFFLYSHLLALKSVRVQSHSTPGCLCWIFISFHFSFRNSGAEVNTVLFASLFFLYLTASVYLQT